jgi:hypothetical protein
MPHRIDGLDLKFTARTSWIARVSKDGKPVMDVPVAWADQMTWDREARTPGTFLVWLTTEEKAATWLAGGDSVIAIAQAVDANERRRRFKQFVRLYKVRPIEIGAEPITVLAKYVSTFSGDSVP